MTMDKRENAWRGVLADIGRTRTAQGRARLGRYSIEGIRLHERAMRAGVSVEVALVAQSFAGGGEERVLRLLAELDSSGCHVHVVPDEIVRQLTDRRDIGAIVGLVHLPAACPIDRSLAGLEPQPGTILVAAGVEDPGNVGAMIRTALAAGASAFVAVGISDPYHPKAVRTSMGAVFRLPILLCPEMGPLIEALNRRGVATVGAVSRGGSPPEGLGPDLPALAVLVGSEAFGLSAETCAELDHLVSIPMSSDVDSFSANAAAAILLYALRRPA